MLEKKEIAKESRRFIIGSVIAVVLLAVAVTAVSWLTDIEGLAAPLAVGVAFTLVVESADILVWRKVAQKGSIDALATFLSAVSGFRMLLALLTLVGCYIAVGGDAFVKFLVVFAVFYLWIIVHHSVFFSSITKLHA
jgi:hypothetical protein